MYTINTDRLGLTHASVEGERFPIGEPVDLNAEQVKAIESLPGFTVGQADKDVTVAELKERAKDAGIEGYSSMNKAELTKALADNDNKGNEGNPGFAGGSATEPATP